MDTASLKVPDKFSRSFVAYPLMIIDDTCLNKCYLAIKFFQRNICWLLMLKRRHVEVGRVVKDLERNCLVIGG